MTHGEVLSEDQKQLIRQALNLRHAAIHTEKNRTADQTERDRLTERLRSIEDTVASVEEL